MRKSISKIKVHADSLSNSDHPFRSLSNFDLIVELKPSEMLMR